MKLKEQKGFTLMEVLTTVMIISVLIGITAFVSNCVFKSTNYEETKVKGSQILTTLESIYADTGVIPIGSKVSIESIDKEVIEDVKQSIPSIEQIITEGNLYEINPDDFVARGEMTDKDVSKFYVVYFDSKNNKYEQYKKYNLTLISTTLCEQCGGNTFSHIVGKAPYENIPNSLKFELDERYVSCPNSSLGFKLDDEDCKVLPE